MAYQNGLFELRNSKKAGENGHSPHPTVPHPIEVLFGSPALI
jgi:hypothetical protein